MKSGVHAIEIPHQAPVMVLPNAVLLPNIVLPLYIFEPKYREMLSWALANDRMFCVALAAANDREDGQGGNFCRTAGIGLIRACVKNANGTSHLLLHGLSRVKLPNIQQEAPFVLADVQAARTHCTDPSEAAELGHELASLCTVIRDMGFTLPAIIAEQIKSVPEPEILVDLVAGQILSDPRQQQRILEAVNLEERLKLVIQFVKKRVEV